MSAFPQPSIRMASTLIHSLPWLLVLASCSSPPKPPTVDESTRRPANTPTAVELQVCKIALHNTRLLAGDAARRQPTVAPVAEPAASSPVDGNALLLERLAMHQQAVAALRSPQVQANTTFTVRFAFGSSRVEIAPEAATGLVDEAKQAPLVLLRGRTDGASDAPSESRIARARAEAVRTWLVNAGVDAARIRTSYQPSGDHAADNATAAGQALNRRVEIELYRALPVAMGQSVATAP